MGVYLEGGLEVLTGHGVTARVGLPGGRLAVGSGATLNRSGILSPRK
jgi:hypothetical protein